MKLSNYNSALKNKKGVFYFLGFYQKKYMLTFILVNLFVALSGFIRSFVFMKIYDFQELGTLTIVNTSAMLLGFMQLGLLNGGYRIVSLGKQELSVKTNNVVFSYFFSLLIAVLVVASIALFNGYLKNNNFLFTSILLGISMLVSNWLTNVLTGAKDYKNLNLANITSSIISLFCLVFVIDYGLNIAILSLLIQPCIFISIVLIRRKDLRPIKFELDFTHINYILGFGFIPFLSGMFILIFQQIERWSINMILGPDALGKMYMVFISLTLWTLIPSSINNLYFPKSIRAYSEGAIYEMKRLFTQYMKVLIVYSCIGFFLILFILPSLVGILLPNHLPYLFLVNIALPGFVFRNLSDPISLFLNSIVRLKHLLWSDILSTVFYSIAIIILYYSNNFTLSNSLLCFSGYNLFRFLYLYFIYLKINKNRAV